MSIKGKPGFRIKYEIERPAREILDKLHQYSTPNISDAMLRFRAMDHLIKPLNKHYLYEGYNTDCL